MEDDRLTPEELSNRVAALNKRNRNLLLAVGGLYLSVFAAISMTAFEAADRLEKKLNKVRDEVSESTDQISSLESEFRDKLAASEKRVSEVEDDANATFRALEATREEARESLRKTRAELKRSQKGVKENQQLLASSRAEITDMKSRLEEMTAEAHELKLLVSNTGAKQAADLKRIREEYAEAKDILLRSREQYEAAATALQTSVDRPQQPVDQPAAPLQ